MSDLRTARLVHGFIRGLANAAGLPRLPLGTRLVSEVAFMCDLVPLRRNRIGNVAAVG